MVKQFGRRESFVLTKGGPRLAFDPVAAGPASSSWVWCPSNACDRIFVIVRRDLSHRGSFALRLLRHGRPHRENDHLAPISDLEPIGPPSPTW